jgi:leucine-rich repeat protein SHOC2
LTLLYLGANQLTELLPEIGKLTKLKWLYLGANDLTELPPEIGNLTKLDLLYLDANQLTELPPEIGKLTKLEWLALEDNPITDADLEHLKPLGNLKELDVSNTNVTKEGVESLKTALPNCHIVSDFKVDE